MKITSLILTILFLIGCSGHNSKSLHATPEVVTWKELCVSDTIQKEITISNRSNRNLKIDYIQKPCDCIITKFQHDEINAKDSLKLHLTFIPQYVGYTEQNIFVHFKNTKEKVHLLIKGKVSDDDCL